jgi:hypothetical protein
MRRSRDGLCGLGSAWLDVQMETERIHGLRTGFSVRICTAFISVACLAFAY